MGGRRLTLSAWDHIAILLTAGQMATSFYILQYGAQGPIPMHFNAMGEVDRWGDRTEVAIVLLVFAVMTMGAHLIVNLAASRPGLDARSRRAITYGRVLGFMIAGGMLALFGALGMGRLGSDEPRSVVLATLAGIWVLIAAVGATMGKTRPNRWAGVRVYWTFKSRLAWEKANRLLGRVYFFGGIAGLLALPFLPRGGNLALFVAIVFGGAATSTFEAWRVWRNDPERIP